jgi:hypothetical protein
MDLTRARAFAAFEITVARLAARQRDPNAWEEGNLLEALVAITSGDYDAASARIAAAARQPTPAEVSAIVRRRLLTRAEILDRFDDLRAEQESPHSRISPKTQGGGFTGRPLPRTLSQ